jgi:hypothetical protein
MRRTIEVNGDRWEVYPSGRVTVYNQDEYGIVFETGAGEDRVRRVTRYSPLGARRQDRSLSELSDQQLMDLFKTSQPAWTSPVTEYTTRSS